MASSFDFDSGFSQAVFSLRSTISKLQQPSTLSELARGRAVKSALQNLDKIRVLLDSHRDSLTEEEVEEYDATVVELSANLKEVSGSAGSGQPGSPSAAAISTSTARNALGLPSKSTFDIEAGHPLALQMASQADRVARSRALLADTEEIGVAIMTDLSTQRETIQGALNKTTGASAELGRANSTVRGMRRRDLYQKLMLAGMGLFFVVFLIVVFWLKLR